MKTYDRASQDILTRMNAVIEKFHDGLKRAEVSIDVLVISGDEGHALFLRGRACDGVVRIIGLKDRVKGLADAEITLDKSRWDAMTAAERDALLDHELYHLMVRYDDDGQFLTDDAHRPKLRMRPHDIEFGWFVEIARRHGSASGEVQAATIIKKQYGQILFDFVENLSPANADLTAG